MVASREILTGAFNYLLFRVGAQHCLPRTAASCATARRAFDSAIRSELVRATLATVRLRLFLMAVSGRDHRRIEDAIDALRQGTAANPERWFEHS
jgi:hypothetical protein